MPRYIDADLINWTKIAVPMLDGMLVRTKTLDGVYANKNDVDAILTADVKEVSHGDWIAKKTYLSAVWCSQCDKASEEATPYCPFYGAQMSVAPKEETK